MIVCNDLGEQLSSNFHTWIVGLTSVPAIEFVRVSRFHVSIVGSLGRKERPEIEEGR
jgi:hypothetical protein